MFLENFLWIITALNINKITAIIDNFGIVKLYNTNGEENIWSKNRKLSIDELLEISGMNKERAGELIMTARIPWFENEETANESSD